MQAKIKCTDFSFRPAGSGHYYVTYQSPATCKKWIALIDDMELIDAVKNTDNPERKALNELKRRIKELCK
jgi:hypothetical protein